MDWANERYVRLYTRDTDDWDCLSWEAQSLWCLLLRKLDRAGVFETRRGARGVAGKVRMPVEVVERALAELLADGCLVEYPGGYVAPNFIEAQEASQSEKQRTRESRARRADLAKREAEGLSRLVTPPPGMSVTNRDEHADDPDTDRDEHPGSAPESVTPDYPSPDQTSRAVLPARARDPGAPVLDRHRWVREQAWAYARGAYQTLHATAIDPSRPLDVWPEAMDLAGGDQLHLRVNELISRYPNDYDRVLVELKRVVDVRVAEARAKGTLRWLVPDQLWSERQFKTALGMTPADFAPRSTGNTTALRDPAVQEVLKP